MNLFQINLIEYPQDFGYFFCRYSVAIAVSQ